MKRILHMTIAIYCLLPTKSKAQLLPEFWFSPNSDTILMIDPKGESPHHTFSYVFILGAPMDGSKSRIRWFRAFMDSTKNKNTTGYDLIKADTLRKYNFKLRGEQLTTEKIDSIDIYYPVYDTQEIDKGQDSTIRIFRVTYSIKLSVGREQVIETGNHYYEYVGASAEEAYEKPILTIHGWMVPGTRKQIWMMGCGDVYQDIQNNRVMSVPASYFGLR
ncbi:MAG: hypothetical protein ACHQF2_02430 [Flavobacteriales bacterium]